MRTSPIQTVRASSPCSAPLYLTLLLQCGTAWSTQSRCSWCWVSSAKYTPKSSALPPGPAYCTLLTRRTRSPPRVTTTCLKVASRPTTASYWPPCTAPGAQSCTETSVTSAPSPIRTATPPAYLARPLWSRTTVALANAPTSTTSWPQTTSAEPVPARPRPTGRSSCASGATRTTAAPPLRCRARAASRSAGSGRPLSSGSSASTLVSSTPSGRSVVQVRCASEGAPSSSARTRFIGVNRHVSSRPVGTPKASGSSEVNRSAGEPVGVGPPCEWAPGTTPVASAGVVGGPACAPTPGAKSSPARVAVSVVRPVVYGVGWDGRDEEPISRRHLPSAARSGG